MFSKRCKLTHNGKYNAWVKSNKSGKACYINRGGPLLRWTIYCETASGTIYRPKYAKSKKVALRKACNWVAK